MLVQVILMEKAWKKSIVIKRDANTNQIILAQKAISISPASYQKASLTISHYLITLDLLKTSLDSCHHAKLTY